MNKLMQQAQKLQREIAEAQEEAAQMTGSAEAGGGMVKVTVNSQHQIASLEIAKDVVDPDDLEMLQDLLMAAFNEAIRDLDERMEERMSQATSGMPGLPNMGGFGF